MNARIKIKYVSFLVSHYRRYNCILWCFIHSGVLSFFMLLCGPMLYWVGCKHVILWNKFLSYIDCHSHISSAKNGPVYASTPYRNLFLFWISYWHIYTVSIYLFNFSDVISFSLLRSIVALLNFYVEYCLYLIQCFSVFFRIQNATIYY